MTILSVLNKVGAYVTVRWAYARRITSVTLAVLALATRRRSWPRTVRALLVRQILFTGVDALGLIVLIGVLTGVSVVAQAQYWLTNFGQSGMLGSILVAVIIREAGPLLVNFVVIGRSGTAIATELAGMRVRGEVGVLEGLGVDPMTYLVMPRVLAMAISVFVLTGVLAAVSLVCGFMLAAMRGVTPGDFHLFGSNVLMAIAPADLAAMVAKTLLPGLITGVICCADGLGVSGAVTDVPRAATSAVVRSLAALLLVSAVISLVTYGS